MTKKRLHKLACVKIEDWVRFPICKNSPGKMLKSLRKRRGASQKQLAKHLKVNNSLVSRWEADTRPIRPSYVDHIAEFLLLFKEEREELLRKIQDEAIQRIIEKP